MLKDSKVLGGRLYDALLLIGPTGAGKTPLGELLEIKGYRGRRCVHFDFGSALRTAASGPRPLYLNEESYGVIKDSLRTGALLEDVHFPIACGILERFMADREVRPADLLVLNGIPRHAGQASAMEGMVRMQGIVWLKASYGVIMRRIRNDAGGDRRGRPDDTPEWIRERMRLFRERTRPLIAYYRKRHVPFRIIRAGLRDTAETLWARLEHQKPLNGLLS